MHQLELFGTPTTIPSPVASLAVPPSNVIVDAEVDRETADSLLKLVTRKKRGVTVQRIIHPVYIKQVIPDFSDRSVWTDHSLKDIRVNTKRIRLLEHGKTCECCGRPTNLYTVETMEGTPGRYLNAYTVTDRGAYEMTVDHIVPKCIGGNDSSINRATMCRLCNEGKANFMRLAEIERVSADLESYLKPWANRDYVRTVLELQRMRHFCKGGDLVRVTKCLNANMVGVTSKMNPESYDKRIRKMNLVIASLRKQFPIVQSEPLVVEVQISWFERLSMWLAPVANAFVFPR